MAKDDKQSDSVSDKSAAEASTKKAMPALAPVQTVAQLQEIIAGQADTITSLREELQQASHEIVTLQNSLSLASMRAPADQVNRAPGHAGTHLRVAALRNGYFRAGREFGVRAVDVALEDLSEAQEKAIREDAQLVVVDL